MQEQRGGGVEEGSCSCSLWSPDYSVKSALLMCARKRVDFRGERGDAAQCGDSTPGLRSPGSEGGPESRIPPEKRLEGLWVPRSYRVGGGGLSQFFLHLEG